MHEPLRFTGKVLRGIVSRTADPWFLRIVIEIPDPPNVHRENPAAVGVGLGVSALATLSTGEKIVGPQAYAAAQATLRRFQQHLSRQMEAAKVSAHFERDAHPVVEEHGQGSAPHRATPCLDCPYPGKCPASVDHDACGTI
jgi:hypothetical protein